MISGKTEHFMNNKAFTLIELLVVVLIIGILAAVALPQYQVAVRKARAVQLRARADALYKGASAYEMATGEWPTDVRELDIDIGEDSATYQKLDDTSVEHIGAIYENGSRCGVWKSPAGNKTVLCADTDVMIRIYPDLDPRYRCDGLTPVGIKACNFS